MWVVALRLFPHSDQEGSQALEGLHSGLKGGAMRGVKRIVGRRGDWLVHTVFEDVLPHYQRNATLRAAGFGGNQQAAVVARALDTARMVPDCRVIKHA